jgi:hypothetical protein
MKLLLCLLALFITSVSYGMHYVEGCGKDPTTYETEVVCIRNEGPSKMSKACSLYTATYINEKNLLRES